ncbi:hypothetical protein CPAR01_10703, partial [Colletotrichum paranaense]
APLCICIRSLQDPCPSERCSRVQLDTSSTRFSAVQLPTSLFSPVERFMLFAERKKRPKTHQRSTHDTPLIVEESTSDGVLTVPRYPICRDTRKGTAPPPPCLFSWRPVRRALAGWESGRPARGLSIVVVSVVGCGGPEVDSVGPGDAVLLLFRVLLRFVVVKDCCVGFSYDLGIGAADHIGHWTFRFGAS